MPFLGSHALLYAQNTIIYVSDYGRLLVLALGLALKISRRLVQELWHQCCCDWRTAGTAYFQPLTLNDVEALSSQSSDPKSLPSSISEMYG